LSLLMNCCRSQEYNPDRDCQTQHPRWPHICPGRTSYTANCYPRWN
jgi:hypothetical protein